MSQETILIKGLNISYKTAGEGKPLLILHGWGSKKEKWQAVERILIEKGIKVIIPDLPGFGKSSKPSEAWSLDDYCSFIEEFSRALNLDRFCLLGHSFGGALAVKCSLRFPEKIEKMILMGAACFREEASKKSFLGVLSKVLRIFSFLPFYSLLRRAFYKFIVRKSDYASLEGVMKETYLKVISQDLCNELSSVEIPSLIIWGEQDDITPLHQAHLINKKIMGSKLEIIKNGSHDLEWKMPEQLSRLIIKFIRVM